MSIFNGVTFVASNDNGDIEPSPSQPTGLFSFDTRFLSTWVLTINGERLNALSVDIPSYFESRLFLIPGELTEYVDATLSVIRRRVIGVTFDEQVSIFNHDRFPVDLTVEMAIAADFADIFDIKDAKPRRRTTRVTVENGQMRMGYEREAFRRSTTVSSTVPPVQVDERGMTFQVRIAPQEFWTTTLQVCTNVQTPLTGTDLRETNIYESAERLSLSMGEDLQRWRDKAPKLDTDSKELTLAYRQSLDDLAALRFRTIISPMMIPAAGLPWFMAGFGRDSIFTSLQTLPFKPELAVATLNLITAVQGTHFDDFREEEPGKILHETRYGESSAFEEQPHSPYMGSADSTPLFVILLDEYQRWSGDVALPRRLEFEARAALAWIDTYANITGDGYVRYQRRNEQTGLVNQCWKDSWNSISFRDGRLPRYPLATCEIQGYAYDAKMRGARLAREFWDDPDYADQLEREASELKGRFNRDFWVVDGGYYSLALDPDGVPVDALSSNIGHLLWSGIVDESRAAAVVGHLMGPRLFSGWGIRTLAEGEGNYNPVGYHNGTVWPFDNSIIAWGMWRYGYRDEAARVAQAIIDAVPYFDGRLPEALAGYRRDVARCPIEYPTACSPQAWSTGAPLLLLRVMLGLEPDGQRLLADPVLPERIQEVNLSGVLGSWGTQNITASR
ncbi:glycogen debranching N-terminal domain-containing protein [Micromonospora chersina]|uniref:amylo-alpha-1,6-glucosidase n=1 Tax=Micromonospora chersina TaxID=47854 RepID=UPI0037B88B32